VSAIILSACPLSIKGAIMYEFHILTFQRQWLIVRAENSKHATALLICCVKKKRIGMLMLNALRQIEAFD